MKAGEASRSAGEPEVAEVGREGPEDGAELPAGEVGAEAEVLAVAEGDMGVRVAADIEAVGVGELALVSVGRGVPEDDGVAGVDVLALQLDIGRLRCGRTG